MRKHTFAEDTALPPEAALRHFTRLEPLLGVDPHRFGPDHERRAFTLAAATEETLLEAVQEAIAEALRTGAVSDAPSEIERLLDAAGVGPRNQQYAEMVFRTNAADAYNQGSWEEYRSPDVEDEFPAWEYSNPCDGRSRPRHCALSGKYFPASVSFAEVRGTGIEDTANDRCTFLPIHKSRWAKLQAEGARFHRFSERWYAEDARGHEHRGKGKGGGQFVKKGKGGAAGAAGHGPEEEAHPGSTHGSSVAVKPVKARAFGGESASLKTTLTKQETGRVGEAVVLAYLKHLGFEDARPMNSGKTNFPIDLIEDHAPTEVKAGLASNSRKAQQWRLTFSKETKAEKEWYEKATPEQRKAWNAEKQKRIHERKLKVIRQLEKETGEKVKPRTMTVIINPDTRTADLYEFDGWHDRIDWQSPAAKAAYKATVQYA